MKTFLKSIVSLILFLTVLWSCNDNKSQGIFAENNNQVDSLTIFFINDQHGQLENFAKIKHIIDQEKLITSVLVTASGDMFSGNPVVDNYSQKGYPMIDIMNDVGFDIALLGNHEFDYGEAVLSERMKQANFDWVCANVDMSQSVIEQPNDYKTITIGDLDITFLGLVETYGKDDDIIPSTHPWRVQNLTFQRHESILSDYADLKASEGSDLLIALTHLGSSRDVQLASDFPFFDVILGGHSHQKINNEVNGIPIFQTGSYLKYLGKVTLAISDKSIQDFTFELIDLDNYSEFNAILKDKISTYNDDSGLDEVIGYSEVYHDRESVGCFYTDALRSEMMVDLTFQNTGGVRNSLDQGNILTREIYAIDPFNNGSVIYSMTVGEVKEFLSNAGGFYYSGLDIQQDGQDIIIKNNDEEVLEDDVNITVGVNDYIPAVYDQYFPSDDRRTILPLTTAETIISYLNHTSDSINYPECNRYFRYQ